MVKKVKEEAKQEEEEEEKPEEEEKAEEAPKWAVELKASFDKMADAFGRYAEAKVDKQEAEEEEEEKPEEEEKQEEEEEEEPEEEEEKAEEKVEKVEYFEEEGKKSKKSTKIDEYVKAEVAKQVADALKKNLETPAVKRSKAIKKVKVTEDESMTALHNMSWAEVRKLAEERGAY